MLEGATLYESPWTRLPEAEAAMGALLEHQQVELRGWIDRSGDPEERARRVEIVLWTLTIGAEAASR